MPADTAFGALGEYYEGFLTDSGWARGESAEEEREQHAWALADAHRSWVHVLRMHPLTRVIVLGWVGGRPLAGIWDSSLRPSRRR